VPTGFFFYTRFIIGEADFNDLVPLVLVELNEVARVVGPSLQFEWLHFLFVVLDQRFWFAPTEVATLNSILVAVVLDDQHHLETVWSHFL